MIHFNPCLSPLNRFRQRKSGWTDGWQRIHGLFISRKTTLRNVNSEKIPVKAAATDSMAVLTGIEGHYDSQRGAYLPPPTLSNSGRGR